MSAMGNDMLEAPPYYILLSFYHTRSYLWEVEQKVHPVLYDTQVDHDLRQGC